VFEVAKCLIGGNERQAKRMPMLFSPTIGAAITARSQFGARRVIPLIHRRFRVSNSIQIQNSRWPKVSTWSGRNLRGGDAMLVADYIAISVLIVLALWAGLERFPRGKRFIFPNTPRDRATE